MSQLSNVILTPSRLEKISTRRTGRVREKMVYIEFVPFQCSTFSGRSGIEEMVVLTAEDHDICHKWEVPHQKIQDLRVVPSRKPDEQNFETEG